MTNLIITVYVEDDEPFDTDLASFLRDNVGDVDATELRFTLASNGVFIGGGGAAPAFAVHRSCGVL